MCCENCEGKVDTTSMINDLERRLAESKAQQVHQYHFASVNLNNAGDHNQGGAVIISITALGGKVIVDPVAIKNGLGSETIEALQADLLRSYNDAIQFKPKGA